MLYTVDGVKEITQNINCYHGSRDSQREIKNPYRQKNRIWMIKKIQRTTQMTTLIIWKLQIMY